jgi:putative transposase
MSKPSPSISVRHAVAMWPADAPRGAVTAFCTEHGVSRAWFYKVRSEAKSVGVLKALETKRPVPLTSPGSTTREMTKLLLETRADLESEGKDHGPLSVIATLSRRRLVPPSRATVARIFTRAGVVVPEPRKKPRSAYQRFVYPQPNACWQIDATEWRLASGKAVAIFQLLDDHSRLALASLVATGETSEAAVAVVALGMGRHGVPEKFLSDNGAALNPTRRGRTGALVDYLTSHGVEPITGKPGKPTTQGKNERFHQTLHRYLRRQPPAASMTMLQAQVDAFDLYYNTEREHQALPGRRTPQEAWDATPKTPAPARPDPAITVPDQRLTTQRQVALCGRISVLGTAFNMGRDLAGSTIHVVYDHLTIMFFDAHGTEIITHPRPAKGTRYVGNGKPSGIAADPAGARRKRTKYPPLKRPQTPGPMKLSTKP